MKTALITLLILILAALGYMFYTKDSGTTGIVPSRNGDDGAVCTMEAKQCPDGSYVGRSGPNCEFAECPKGVKAEVSL